MRRARILGIVMAGGKGERLHPLTRERSKPGVPFGGKYRIVDFVLSNFVNSGIFSLYVLVQYKSQSLIEHLQIGWRHGGLLRDHFISVVPPQMRMGEMWYRGTADAVAQNLHLIQDFNPDMVAIFGADHIYRMDLNQMLAFHAEREADVTVAALPVPLEQASGFGVIEADSEDRVLAFHEKPRQPVPMPGDPSRAYGSMGNYIFTKEVLVECLLEDVQRPTEHDFGKHVIPRLVGEKLVYAYNFLTHQLP
ncbi:MAG: sugar phosphate nucleotidyltransferase, partial [Candidatus Methylomirabilales bacterium]